MGQEIKKIVKEFKDFAMRGSFLELAIGIVVGSAFTKIINSFVDDILMPPISLMLGKVDLPNHFVSLSSRHFTTLAEAKNAGAATLNYGIFINNIITFLLVSIAIFFIVKQMNRLRRKDEGATNKGPTDKNCPYCQSKIPYKATRCPQCTSQLVDTKPTN